MYMELLEELNTLGVDTSEGLDRVMEDRELYAMMLGMFLDAVREHDITPDDFDSGDMDALIQKVHTLKGVTGNLALTPLFEGYVETLGLLRAGDAARGKARYENLLPAQATIIDCIRRHQNN